MIVIGLLNRIFNRYESIPIFDDKSLYDSEDFNPAVKRMSLESVIGMISRTIIQNEYRIKKNGKLIHNKTYYKLNVKPNKNQSAAAFWSEVIFKLIYDGECLIVKSRTDDLLIADDYSRNELAVREDKFSNVFVRGLELDGTFARSEVLFFEYGNEELSRLVDSLFCDYGELLKRMFESQKTKGQIRATVNVESSFIKTEEGQRSLQNFINRTYKAIKEKVIAIIPQQKGMTYQEHSKQNSTGQSVEEINTLSNGFLHQVCNAVGLPPSLLKGDLADAEQLVKTYMKFCIDAFNEIIGDELNKQFIDEKDFLNGERIEIKRMSYKDLFDVASAIDKLRSSSVVDGHELRDEVGLSRSDNPIHDEFILTKNYDIAGQSEGGE